MSKAREALAELLRAVDAHPDRNKLKVAGSAINAAFVKGCLALATPEPEAAPAAQAEPVAWADDGALGQVRVVSAQTKLGMPRAASAAYTMPLVHALSPKPSQAGPVQGEGLS